MSEIKGTIYLGGVHKLEPINGNLPATGELVHVGYIETHARPDTGEPCSGMIATHAEYDVGRPHWTIVQQDPITLTPSILCRSCGAHGWIRDGKWVDA